MTPSHFGLTYIQHNGGAGYFPERIAAPYLQDGRLHLVTDAPRFRHSVYMVYDNDRKDERFFHLPLPPVELLLFDPGLVRHLADTPYAERRKEAETRGTPAAKHVAEEQARVQRGIEMLDAGDIRAFGALLYESHASLRDQYRCSHPLLDDYVAQLSRIPDVYGARMVGGGWGGTVLALADPGTRLEGGLNVISDDALARIED